MPDRWPTLRSLPFVVIGLWLVVYGVQHAHFEGLVEFRYYVEATTQAAANDAVHASDGESQVVYQFSNLTTTAQDLFLRAHSAPDQNVAIRGMEHQVTELGSAGDTGANPGRGLYYVVYEGSYFEFRIHHPMSLSGFSAVVGYTLAAGGVVLGTVGSLLYQPARNLLAHLGGTAAFLAAYSVTGWWSLNEFTPLLLVGVVAAYVPAASAWCLYGALRT